MEEKFKKVIYRGRAEHSEIKCSFLLKAVDTMNTVVIPMYRNLIYCGILSGKTHKIHWLLDILLLSTSQSNILVSSAHSAHLQK